jgi:hypothetical protein
MLTSSSVESTKKWIRWHCSQGANVLFALDLRQCNLPSFLLRSNLAQSTEFQPIPSQRINFVLNFYAPAGILHLLEALATW